MGFGWHPFFMENQSHVWNHQPVMLVKRSRGVASGNQTWLCLKLPMTDVSPRQPLAAMFDDQEDGQPAFPIITRPGKHTKIDGKSRKFTICSWVDHIPRCHEYSMNIPWIRIHPHVISKNCSLVIDGQGIICRLQCIGPMAQLDCGLRSDGELRESGDMISSDYPLVI